MIFVERSLPIAVSHRYKIGGETVLRVGVNRPVFHPVDKLIDFFFSPAR